MKIEQDKIIDIIGKHIDKADRDGFDRGVKQILKELMKAMEEDKMDVVSYDSIKGIYEKYLQMHNLKDESTN